MTILQTKNLKKVYGTGENVVHALDGVNLTIEKGEFVAIVGTSGSGKSTLLHMLGGLDRPTSGKVIVDGKDIFSLKQIKQENKTNDIKPAEQQSIQPTVEQLAENTGIENNEVIDNIEENKQEIITYEVIWPHKGEITSNFGERESTDSRVTGNHTGIDIAGNLGDKIISAINGKVLEVSEEGRLGKHMKIENENIITVYAHCNNIYVKEGEEIKQGQEIGEVGSTGNSTGNHLHFETILNGEYIDPMSVIENNNIFMKNENQPEDSKEGEV